MSLPSKTFTTPLRALALAVAACATGLAHAASSVTLSLVPDQAITPPGTLVEVLVDLAQTPAEGESPLSVFGAQVALRYDDTRLELVGASPVQALAVDPRFAILSTEFGAGTVTFGVFDPTFSGVNDSAGVATISFRVKESVTADCVHSALIYFDIVDVHQTEVAIAGGATVTPKMVNLPELNLDDVAPSLTVVPTEVVLPTDAGSTVGAAVDEPMVEALDECDPEVAVSRVISYPDGTSGDAWPAEFPIGTTTVVWSATDDAGNAASVTQTITVENYQLMDAFVTLEGTSRAANSYDRTVRFSIGARAHERLVTIYPEENSTGFVDGLVVDVASGYPCVTAKDLGFSLSDTDLSVSVVGRRYLAHFSLPQGDCSNDNLVDIIDFGVFLMHEGMPASSDGPANFNADGIVDHADFSYIAINYFRTGESCGAFDGGAPRSSVTVKELRRMGLGHLAAGDLNGDGRIDQRDMQQYLEHGGAARAVSEKAPPTARW